MPPDQILDLRSAFLGVVGNDVVLLSVQVDERDRRLVGRHVPVANHGAAGVGRDARDDVAEARRGVVRERRADGVTHEVDAVRAGRCSGWQE